MATLDSYFRKDAVYLHDKLVQGKTVIKKCMFITDLLSDFRRIFFLNDTYREKLCFTQFRTRMAAWLLLTFFYQQGSVHFIIIY